MTKALFSGFPTGSKVSISATMNGVTSGPINITAWNTVTDTAPTLDSVTITDGGAGAGTLVVTFDAGETTGTSVIVRGYIDTPADADPASGAVVAAGTGAVATFTVTTTVGATGVSVPISGGALSGTYDVFVAASYDSGSTWSNVVSDLAVDFDTTVPTVSSVVPADNATDVAIAANLVITFSEAMSITTGTVTLKLAGGANVQVFTIGTDGTWSVGNTVLTLNPTADLNNSANYAIRWAGLTDANGNALADVADDTTYNFTTATAVTNLVPDPGFDNANGEWASIGSSVSVSDGLAKFDGTNTASVRTNNDYFVPVTAGLVCTVSIEVVTVRHPDSRSFRITADSFDGPTTVGNTEVGTHRVGGSTIDVTSDTTSIGGSFTPPEGTTHVRFILASINSSFNADLDNIVVTQ